MLFLMVVFVGLGWLLGGVEKIEMVDLEINDDTVVGAGFEDPVKNEKLEKTLGAEMLVVVLLASFLVSCLTTACVEKVSPPNTFFGGGIPDVTVLLAPSANLLLEATANLLLEKLFAAVDAALLF